jgi:hypothetical protein
MQTLVQSAPHNFFTIASSTCFACWRVLSAQDACICQGALLAAAATAASRPWLPRLLLPLLLLLLLAVLLPLLLLPFVAACPCCCCCCFTALLLLASVWDVCFGIHSLQHVVACCVQLVQMLLPLHLLLSAAFDCTAAHRICLGCLPLRKNAIAAAAAAAVAAHDSLFHLPLTASVWVVCLCEYTSQHFVSRGIQLPAPLQNLPLQEAQKHVQQPRPGANCNNEARHIN